MPSMAIPVLPWPCLGCPSLAIPMLSHSNSMQTPGLPMPWEDFGNLRSNLRIWIPTGIMPESHQKDRDQVRNLCPFVPVRSILSFPSNIPSKPIKSMIFSDLTAFWLYFECAQAVRLACDMWRDRVTLYILLLHYSLFYSAVPLDNHGDGILSDLRLENANFTDYNCYSSMVRYLP